MLKPTEEQIAIVDFAKTQKENLLVNALAGAAKTSTLEMVCNAVTGIPILSLAFNRRIAEEMKKRLPGHVEARTFNSLGHSVWSQAIGRRLTLDTSKTYKILKGLVDELPRPQQREARDSMAAVLGYVRRAKRDGFIPQRWASLGNPVYSDMDEWLDTCDDQPDDLERQLTLQCLDKSIAAAYDGNIDFDDQILMPVCFGGSFPKYPLVCVDEAQDLSPLNHKMIDKLYHKRLIAVGDPWQSIYLFRGSVSNGMSLMQERFSMHELTLSVTFRVPKRGVERARFRVPHMQWFSSAKDGHIEDLPSWSPNTVPAGAAIICRNNAPLFSAALKLLANGRSIKLVGMDIGPNLLRIMRKLGPETLPQSGINAALTSWAERELKRAKRQETVYEKMDCLEVLLRDHKTLGDALMHAEALFKQDGQIQLLSYHKAKGLEWEKVFILDPWRCPSRFAKEGTEEMEQELNARYVAETRFKEEMYLMNLEDFQP